MRALILILSILIANTLCDEVNVKCGSKIAFTLIGNKTQCLNDCVNGQCVVDQSYLLHPCKKTNEDALVHRTIHGEVCHSCCIPYSQSTGACLTKDGNWDYCDTSRNVKWVRDVRLTASNGPCTDACGPTDEDGTSLPRCTHNWLGMDTCNPELGFNYIQARTITGEPCKGACKKHRGRDYTWCLYKTRNEKACALPGYPAQTNWTKLTTDILTTRQSFCVFNEQLRNCERSRLTEDPHRRLVDKMAQELEYNPDYKTVFVHSDVNPVYSYTIEEGEVIKPRVVRAIVRPSHLFYDNKTSPLPEDVKQNLIKLGRERNDIDGYLVGYFMGGPQTTYNIINKKVDAFYYDENTGIVKFLEENKHLLDTKVELLAVPLYPKDKTRAKGVIRRVRMYHFNCLVKDYYEYLAIYDAVDEDNNAPIPAEVAWWRMNESLLPPIETTEQEC